MQDIGLKNLAFSKEFIEAIFIEKTINKAILLWENITIMVNDEAVPLLQENKDNNACVFSALKKKFSIKTFFNLQFLNGSYSFVGEDICIVCLRYYLTENNTLQATFTWQKVAQAWQIGAINFYCDIIMEDNHKNLLTISPRLYSLYTGMQAGILRCSVTLSILEATDFFYKKFNFSKIELESRYENNLLSLISPQDREAFQKIITDLRQGDYFEFVTTFLINNASIFVFLTGELIEQNGKQYVDILVTNSALIKRKKEKIQKAAEEINFIYNSIPSVVFRCSFSEERIISFANQAFYDFIEYSEEEFSDNFANSFSQIMVQDDSIFVWHTISKNIFLNKEEPILVETRIKTKNNSIKHLVLRTRLMYNEEGVPYLYCVGYDRTEVYQYEEDLHLAKQKLELAVAHLNISFWEYDPRTGNAYITRFKSDKTCKEEINNFVSFMLDKNLVDPDYFELFCDLHERLATGVSYAEANILLLQGENQERVWKKFRYSTIFDNDKKPLLCIGTSEDINAYMEIKNKLAIATQQAGITIWIYNIQTNEISVENDTMINFPMQSMVKHYPENRIESGAIFSEDIETYRTFYNNIREGIPNGSCEIRVFDYRKQEYTWVKLNYTLMLDYKNEPEFALGTAIDISEIKKAEAQYKEQVQLWEIAQHNTFGCLVFNVNTKKIIKSRLGKFNDIATNDIDIELARFKQFILKKDQQEQFEKMVDLDTIITNYNNGITVCSCIFQGRFYSKPMWLECEMKVMKHYETGQLLAFLSLHDITNSTLKAKFAEVCLLYQIDFIFQIDLKNDTYSYWAENNTFDKEVEENLVGLYSYDAPRILSYYAVEEDRSRIIYEMSLSKIVSRSLEGNNFEIGCRFVRRRNGQEEIRYKRFHIFLYDEILQTICIGCMDITELSLEEQRRNDELYQALENTRQANRSKSSFLASMSHDLRTPMNAIIGMTNLALSDLKDDKQIKESLDIIKSSSNHLLNLLNDILEMVKIESGKMSYSKSVFSIKEVTQRACDVFIVLVKQKNITFKLSFEDIVHEFVESDETRYQRIISNIISNALKFTPQNGSVSVCVKEVLTIRNNIAQFLITIKDTGIGIPEEQLQFIFDPFHRVESSMISKIEGSGLGLAIVKALVEGLGGTIKVESVIDKGSTFMLDLPFAVEKKKNEGEINKAEKAQSYSFQDISALLVEDHPINIVVIKKMLEKLGMQITITKNGKEGAETFIKSDKNTFDIIFMDLQMPVLNGFDATIAIRESNHPRAKTIPIVAMTANTFEEDIKKCFEVGMNGHIAKPVINDMLIKTLLTLGIGYLMD